MAALTWACSGNSRDTSIDVELVAVANGLAEPTAIVSANDDTDRLFVAERAGTIRIVSGKRLVQRPFLDLSDRVISAAFIERGLLGVAFHPSYEDNGRFFVFYTRRGGVFGGEGDVTIAEYRVSALDASVADPRSERIVLVIDHKGVANHNGGQLAFGPDGYLYIGVGDASSTASAAPNAQDAEVLLGKILRIDVESKEPYAVPPSNPFVDLPGADEVWAYGLRNPWRFSFDRESGDLFIADVGAAASEEVNVQSSESQGGKNYGWPIVEGTKCDGLQNECNRVSFVSPVLTYGHDDGSCAIVGGYVYRGDIGGLNGSYLYGDACSGTIWHARPSGGTWTSDVLLEAGFQISTFGEDEAGEVYVTDFEGGSVYRLATANER